MIISDKISKTSDKLSKDKIVRIIEGLIKDNMYREATYVCFGFFTAQRVSDILDWKWEFVLSGDTFGTSFNIQEQKTSKVRNIIFNVTLIKVMTLYWKSIGSPRTGFIFCNQFGNRISERWVNYMLKKANLDYLGKTRISNMSSHSLRKSFCWNYYISNGRTEASLHILQKILNHSNIGMTMIYLGLQAKSIEKAYNVKIDIEI
jgi:integrase